ncbi:TIM barrel protein [Glycomyces buryatensis]|uniref:2-keto-myo-inositol dehydratase n=1 Tax=Glycomyces buryatensis TaxID=2570927 RepID=A0A4S8PXL7_9ACTN|nr:TIM barrel protein [Glycomyces buryatensis]THV36350.1 2-keto-myo-inositol dehydratase [Glycomyces buryatensis]
MTTQALNLRLGSAPDSWGVWFPEDEFQLPYGQFLDELAGAGYEWLELGPYGYLPTDPDRLADEVGRRGLKVSGGTVFGNLHDPALFDQTIETVSKVAKLTASQGARHVVFIPPLFRDEKTDAVNDVTDWDAEQWKTVHATANRIGRRMFEEHGVTIALHPHADTQIMTQDQIETFLDGTDSNFVSLCLDTGHVAYGGGDNLDLIRRYAERIGYVHIKQMDPEVLQQVNDEGLGFGEAVKRGVCVEPPAGVPDPADIVTALAGLDAELFVIVEQDLYPCESDVPYPIAVRTRKYLNNCGLGARHQQS